MALDLPVCRQRFAGVEGDFIARRLGVLFGLCKRNRNVDGKIVLEGISLTEGAVVAVVTRGADESFSLTEAQKDELLAAMAEIGGEYVTLEELLQSLPKHG